MRNSGILLILSVMVLSSSAHATLADCPSCSGNPPDWVASATDFLEGKPVNDIPSGLNSPQQARFIDAQINSKKNTNQSSNVASNLAVTQAYNSTSMLNIVLNNISAEPNPANFRDPVKIIAFFGNSSAVATPNNRSKMTGSAGKMVYADIKNAAGIVVGRVNLEQTSVNEYAGIWNADLGTGAYDTTIDVSGSQGSKTFNYALQIVVNGSNNTTSNIHGIRKLG